MGQAEQAPRSPHHGAVQLEADQLPEDGADVAVQAQGREITTVEGLADGTDLHPLQAHILATGGVQCGFCTPGMLMSAQALLDRTPNPSLEEIKIGLSGNLCRCTGYARILAAVEATAVEITGS